MTKVPVTSHFSETILNSYNLKDIDLKTGSIFEARCVHIPSITITSLLSVAIGSVLHYLKIGPQTKVAFVAKLALAAAIFGIGAFWSSKKLLLVPKEYAKALSDLDKATADLSKTFDQTIEKVKKTIEDHGLKIENGHTFEKSIPSDFFSDSAYKELRTLNAEDSPSLTSREPASSDALLNKRFDKVKEIITTYQTPILSANVLTLNKTQWTVSRRFAMSEAPLEKATQRYVPLFSWQALKFWYKRDRILLNKDA
jgi:hypothetical protein